MAAVLASVEETSESDYSERELCTNGSKPTEDALALTSTQRAPWYVIPSNHKWFRNLAVSQIVADTMDEMGLKLPPTRVDIDTIQAQISLGRRARVTVQRPAGNSRLDACPACSRFARSNPRGGREMRVVSFDGARVNAQSPERRRVSRDPRDPFPQTAY